ncbi:MAG: hypothetical protein ACRCX8_14285 [Sarcina sp.]
MEIMIRYNVNNHSFHCHPILKCKMVKARNGELKSFDYRDYVPRISNVYIKTINQAYESHDFMLVADTIETEHGELKIKSKRLSNERFVFELEDVNLYDKDSEDKCLIDCKYLNKIEHDNLESQTMAFEETNRKKWYEFWR